MDALDYRKMNKGYVMDRGVSEQMLNFDSLNPTTRKDDIPEHDWSDDGDDSDIPAVNTKPEKDGSVIGSILGGATGLLDSVSGVLSSWGGLGKPTDGVNVDYTYGDDDAGKGSNKSIWIAVVVIVVVIAAILIAKKLSKK